LLFDGELCGVVVGGESGELRDFDVNLVAEVGFWPDAFSFSDIDDFDAEGCLRDV